MNSCIHRWRRFPQRDSEISRAFYAPVVREHPSKPQGRVGSPQRTPDSSDAVAVSSQPQNLSPMSETAQVTAQAVMYCQAHRIERGIQRFRLTKMLQIPVRKNTTRQRNEVPVCSY